MSTLKLFAIATAAALVVTFVVVSTITTSQPQIRFQEPKSDEIHLVASGKRLEVNNPDPAKLYVVESGADVIITAPLGDPARTLAARVIVHSGGRLEAHGTNVDITAQPGSEVTVYDGVVIEATGAKVFVRGNVKLKAFAGTVVRSTGSGEEFAYAGSITYTQAKGRTFAEEGSTVYAKSLDDCDACTQVVASPGSTVYVFDGAEAFGKGATVYVYKGGEVGCAHDCTLFLYAGAEFNYGPACVVHNMPDDDTPDPFSNE